MPAEPREMTPQECRSALLAAVWNYVDYWEREDRRPTARGKLEGLAFSILTLLDGDTPSVPAFLVIPNPHPDDKDYRAARGRNWWPAADKGVDLGTLHEFFFEKGGDRA